MAQQERRDPQGAYRCGLFRVIQPGQQDLGLGGEWGHQAVGRADGQGDLRPPGAASGSEDRAAPIRLWDVVALKKDAP